MSNTQLAAADRRRAGRRPGRDPPHQRRRPGPLPPGRAARAAARRPARRSPTRYAMMRLPTSRSRPRDGASSSTAHRLCGVTSVVRRAAPTEGNDDDPLPQRLRVGRPPPRTRSRAATGTTTGGRGSTRRARGATSRAATRATPGTAGADDVAWSRTSASAPTASRSSGAASSRRRASGRRVALDHYRRCREAAASAASSPSSRSTTSRRRAGSRPRAGGRRPRRPTASPASASAPPSISATGHGPRVHDQRAEHRRDLRLPAACSRPASATRTLRRAVNEVFVAAHRRAVAAIRAAAPGVPVGVTLAMADYQAVDGGEARARPRAPRWRTCSSTPPRATTSSACRRTRVPRRAGRAPGPSPASPLAADGLRVLARGARRDDPARLGP